LHNFKLVNENLDKIMFNRQINAGKISIENAFEILKNKWRILHYTNARVDQGPRIVMVYYVLHNCCQLMGLPSPLEGLQEYPLCCVKGQVPLLHEG
jgi:hypothetical protein